MIGASTGLFGAVWAQAELRKVLVAMGARVVESEVVVGQAGEKIDGGALMDADHHDQLDAAVAALVDEVEPARAGRALQAA